MPARQNPRLAYCEYVSPVNGTAVEQARWNLMRCVRRIFPSMLERLAADVLPAYDELAKSDFRIEAVLWHPRLSPFKELPQDSSLRGTLSKWASEFHAEQDWFLDHMLRTLRGWHVAPDWRSALKCNPIGGVISTLAMGEPFMFDCEGWEMQLLTWADYSQSVRERFEQHLAEYEAASRTLAESRGLVRAPHKYSPLNLEWFVRYQFEGLSATEIVNHVAHTRPNTDESTIRKGIKTAQRLLGWQSLRDHRRDKSRKIRE